MEEEASKPYVAGEQPVSLSWKTRLKSGSAMERPDYGSFYAILPKGQVEELSWDVGQRLTAHIEDDSLILRPARYPPPKVRRAVQAVSARPNRLRGRARRDAQGPKQLCAHGGHVPALQRRDRVL